MGLEIVKSTKELVEEGYDYEVIKDKLVKLGYKQEEIDTIFKEAKKMQEKEREEAQKRVFLTIISILFIIIIGMALYVFLGGG